MKRSIYDITTFGEILIDFTWQGVNEDGQTLFAQNPGGAPANVAVAVAKLGGHTAFIGKAGKDMHGEFLKSVLEKENVETEGMLLDEKYFTTLADTYFPCRFSVTYGTAGKRYHTLCDPARKRKRKYYLV